jgi:RHS repeat-associated protein
LDRLVDAASRISFISENGNPSNANTYGYDAIDRLTSAAIPNTSYAYVYDAVGNRTLKTVGTVTDNYTYSTTSNRIASITPQGGAARTFTFDANGSTTDDGINQYSYDVRGRMVQSVGALGTTIYQINALGQRYRKTNTTEDKIFLYDARGHLIGEASPSGMTTKEYLYLGDVPLVVSTGGALYYVHTDHLDTPRVITDQVGNEVWRWDNTEPFGDSVPNENPSGFGAFEFNLRGAGQYSDRETGIIYNYFRYLDPTRGQYEQSDPIGLRGGINGYAYVKGEPLRYADPFGLSWAGAWQSMKDLWAWSQGRSGNPSYGPNDPITQDLKGTPVMDDIRSQFKANGCKDGVYCGNFQYSQFLSTGTVVGQTVGSFCARLNTNGGMMSVDAWNTWGLESGTRFPEFPGQGSNRGNASVQQMITGGASIAQWPKSFLENRTSGAFANSTTRYQWTEPSPCCK